MPIFKKDINAEAARKPKKDKDGKIVRQFANGGLVFCKDLDNFVTITGWD